MKDTSNDCQFPENCMDEIIPGLWLGDYKSAFDKKLLEDKKINYIIRVMPDFDETERFSDIKYIQIPIKDKNVCIKNLNLLFELINFFIKYLLENKKNVLIHCKRGHHRSAVIVASFLIKFLNIEYINSIAYINSIRPCALRRDTCMVRGLFKYYLFLNNIKCKNIKCSTRLQYSFCKCDDIIPKFL
ncbi:Dual specificity protein phosphatase [uncultured virus]|nr:Dual specificity protein phosphatase [uncultured virus]